MSPRLEGRVALVTGAAQGIGRASTIALCAEGAHVVGVDVDTEGLTRLTDESAASGHSFAPVTGDVRDLRVLQLAVEVAVGHADRLDALVNNVGHYIHRPVDFAASDETQWREAFDLNLWPVMRACHLAIPHLTRTGGGSIVNLTTVEAYRGKPQHVAYAAAKAAVAHFGRSLALEVGAQGIRVNDVAPDVTRSQQLPYERWLSEDDLARVPGWVPIGRLGEPEDVADVVVFLASDQSRFVTGTTIHVDGGTGAAGGWYRTNRSGRGWTNRPHDP